jgi:hypothetical protein
LALDPTNQHPRLRECELSNYFGTDGIRGKVGIKPITADFFLKLGWAVGSVLLSSGNMSKSNLIFVGLCCNIIHDISEKGEEKGIIYLI